MNRRLFLRQSGTLCFVACSCISFTGTKSKIRFGLVTDLHFARRPNKDTRYYEQSENKLTDAVNTFNKNKLDFVIELGDFKDMGAVADKAQTITFLQEIESVLDKFNGPRYHVLGNHDMDSISKAEYLKNTNNSGNAKSRNYYSFTRGGIKFIVLDANYNEDGSDYNCGNFEWTKAMVPDEQLKWLKNELKESELPVVIFIHQLLDYFSGAPYDYCVRNAEKVVDVIETGKNVLAVFQGHYHEGNYSIRNGIHYFTMKAMVEGSFPENNSYAIVEIDEDFNISIDGFANCEDKSLKHQM